jgi:type VI secretion system protein ImpL
MLKYIFAVVFIALAWVGVRVFGRPDAIAIWATVVVMGGLILRVLIKFLLARRAAAKIENALASQGTDDGLRPEVRAQIEEMQAEFQKALRTLKSSKLAKHGKSALAALPWYVIIGPPGSGKSTLLRNSGLKFPYLNAKRGAVRGVAGTRNCDWWLSNEGILLDTAGRWTTEDDDQDEWLAFLDLLRKTRRGRPLNGVLVSISAGDLFDTGADDIPTLAKKLRERIDEVMVRLEVTLPVYLLVTKCDLIGGFVESFGTLTEKERGQIWGLTLPLDSEASARPEMFVERLDRLVDVMETRSLVRLKTDGRPEVARRVFEFPQQFEELCPSLVDLVNDLFSENAYQDSPILRGVYFTSATQEGRPIDRVVQRMAQAIGLSANVDYQPILKAKSYFLRDMFRSVIFPDQNIAGQGERANRRRRWIGIGAAGAAFAAAFAIALTPVLAYSRNLLMARNARDYVEGLVGAAGAQSLEPLSARLEPLYQSSQEILRLAISPDPGMTFGFYQGDKVNPLVGRVARDYVVRPILASDFKRLAALAHPQDRGYQDSLDALHLQKLLTAPKDSGEPRPGHRGTDALKDARDLAVRRWRAHLAEKGLTSLPRGEQVVRDAVEFYLREADKDPELWEPRNTEAVDKFRVGLCEFLKRAPLEQIVHDVNLESLDVSLSQIVGGSLELFADSPRIAGAYTQTGWPVVKALFEARGEGAGEDRDWALQGCEALSADQLVQLRRQYLADYENKWRDFLERIRPRAARDFEEARRRLTRYGEEKPLRKLWEVLFEKMPPVSRTGVLAGVNRATTGLVDKILGKSAAQPDGGVIAPDLRALDKRFNPLLKFGKAEKDGDTVGLDAYYGHLRGVVGALKAYDETHDNKVLKQDVFRAKREIEDLISASDPGDWDQVLKNLLLSPLEGLQVVVKKAGDDGANSRWYENVVVPFRQTLGDHYPFGAGLDADLAVVAKFFHPQNGTLWQYYNEVLAPDLEKLTFKSRPTSSVQYTPELTAYLKRAQAATDLLFPGGTQMAIPVQVNISPMGTDVEWTQMRVGEAPALSYRNGPQSFRPLPWPNSDLNLTVHFVSKAKRDFNQQWVGVWALFRFLEVGNPRPQVNGTEQVLHWVHEIEGVGPLQLDFKPVNLHSALRNLTPPQSIVALRGP